MSDASPMRRWKDGDRYYAKNTLFTLAYVMTDDPAKVGTLGLHGADQMCVQYIDAEKARLWNTAPGSSK